jgi:hypothetical protein
VTESISNQLNDGKVQLTESSQVAVDLEKIPPAQRAQSRRLAAKIGESVQATIGPEVATAVNRTFRFALIFTLLGAVAAWFVRPPKRRSKNSPVVAAG